MYTFRERKEWFMRCPWLFLSVTSAVMWSFYGGKGSNEACVGETHMLPIPHVLKIWKSLGTMWRDPQRIWVYVQSRDQTASSIILLPNICELILTYSATFWSFLLFPTASVRKTLFYCLKHPDSSFRSMVLILLVF